MTPTEITQLEMEAAIKAEEAVEAKSRAQIAALRHQRSLLGSPDAAATNTRSSNLLGVALTLIVASFCAWAFNEQASHHDHHYGAAFIR